MTKLQKGINDLKTWCEQNARMDLLLEWDCEKNDPLTPSDVSYGSKKSVWWKCSKGHDWQAAIHNRIRWGCPYCAGKRLVPGINDLKTWCEQNGRTYLLTEWDNDKNGENSPSTITAKNGHKVWWKCKYNHSWDATVANRVKGTGCPYCKSSSSSMPEQGIAFYLSKACIVEQRKKLFKKEIDVFLPDYNIGVEYDGLYFHSDGAKVQNDNDKNATLTKNGICLIRVKEDVCNVIEDETVIKFQMDNMGSNYEWALKQLCQLLSVLTTNDDFINLDINVNRDRLLIREQFDLTLKKNSLAVKYPEIAAEWNYEKNGRLLPDMFPYGAQQKVWWKCANGHDYQASIGSRTNMKSGCKYCARKALLTGFNDLATLYPDLVSEWDYEKNKGLKNSRGKDISTPDKVSAHTRQSVWWICSKGHSYYSKVSSRSRGNGCSICSSHRIVSGVNDLATINPLLAKEWNYEKNYGLVDGNGHDVSTPDKVAISSGLTVWWKCLEGHEWQAAINNRSRGTKCPVCCGIAVLAGFNDLTTVNPVLAKEWNYEKNKGLVDKRGRDVSVPENVSINSNQRVWWKCTAGHEWQATVANRATGSGCKQCYWLKQGKKVINVETQNIYISVREAARKTGINVTGIYNCCAGKNKTAGGYHWKFVD